MVHRLCRLGTRLAQFARHLEQRSLRLSEITNESWPVVHLGIDVDGVLRIPRCIHLVIPYPLQVGGLSARLTGRNEQVATVLHHQRHHVEV